MTQKLSGIGCEPASVATVAGLRNLVSQQVIDKEESALCFLTGNILKDTDALNEYHFGESTNSAFKNGLQPTSLTYGTIQKYIL
ncbi:hypothetical protein [Peribacillus frigoritolerans]|uniref:hypothetical protein n=1 Tax=Peribacillus frigoritolerans TaxID=450367 RepID=UPI0030B9E619